MNRRARDKKIDAAVRRAFTKSGPTETKMAKHDSDTKPGARGAHYDPPNKGTRKPADRQGRLGTDDYKVRLDNEGRHGDLLLGGRVYTSNPEVVAEAQKAHDDIIDKHAATARQVEFTRADPLPNENAYESAFPGDPAKGKAPASAEGPSRQAKRGEKGA